MQREQQQLSPNQQQMVRPQLPQQPGVPQAQVPNQVPQNGSQQKTKVALQNMLSNRAMSPQQVAAAGQQPQPATPQSPVQQRMQMPPQQPPVPQPPPQQMQPQQPPAPPVPQPQMFNPQQQRPQFMQPQQQAMPQPQRPQVPQGPMMVSQPQPHIRYGPPGAAMGAGSPARPQMTPQARPPMPRPMFLGHQPGNNRKSTAFSQCLKIPQKILNFFSTSRFMSTWLHFLHLRLPRRFRRLKIL